MKDSEYPMPTINSLLQILPSKRLPMRPHVTVNDQSENILEFDDSSNINSNAPSSKQIITLNP
jgi:hypothetical protein